MISSEEFVSEFYELKSQLERNYFSGNNENSRLSELVNAGLTDEQINIIKNITSDLLTDTLYTILLGLDGCASIGNKQIDYKLLDECGNEITGNIESFAWEKFHNHHNLNNT